MKLFNANQTVEIRDVLKSGAWNPNRVAFFANQLFEQLNLTEAEAVLISCHGEYYMCPKAVVKNALERERALAKHSEHYRMGDMFTPTMIRLSQCPMVTRDYAEGLVDKTLNN